MKNHELLDLIGDVKEDYVLEAGNNVTRPRFHWKRWAVCAACAVLVLGVYPVYRALHPPLHSYTVIEGGAQNGPQALITDGASGNHAAVGDETPIGDEPGVPAYNEPDGYIPGQGEAIAQYNNLLQRMMGPTQSYPEWYAGAWLDSSGPKARLAVSIVDGFHTRSLEAQIEEWCGGQVLFVQDMKYPYARLLDMLEQVNQALFAHVNQDDIWLTFSSMGPDIMNNRLEVNFSGLPSDEALAFLARLDPEGDAIFVQVFVDASVVLTGEEVKGPAPGAVEPFEFSLPDEERTEPSPEAEPTPVPGGAQSTEELPEAIETEQPACYDLLDHNRRGRQEKD